MGRTSLPIVLMALAWFAVGCYQAALWLVLTCDWAYRAGGPDGRWAWDPGHRIEREVPVPKITLHPMAELRVADEVDVALPGGGTRKHAVRERVRIPLEEWRAMRAKDKENLGKSAVVKAKAAEEVRLKQEAADRDRAAGQEAPAALEGVIHGYEGGRP